MNIFKSSGRTRAFTLVELIAVIIVLAILSGVAIPRYFDYADRARTAALQGTIGNVRAAVANWYADQSISGSAAYPSAVQLTTTGSVLQEPLPKNPYNNLATVLAVTVLADANNRVTDGTTGWCYYVDNTATPKKFVFWANNTDTTTASDGAGGFVDSNDL